MKKIYFSLLLLLFFLPGDLLAACAAAISVNSSAPGSWEPSCTSTHRTGSYAKYYTFTLSSSQDVTIDLESVKDTYLFLLNGPNQTSSKIAEDDDGGTGTNSQIAVTLLAGTYTIEATTYDPATTGDFVVSVEASPPTPGDCSKSINTNVNVSGSWEVGCLSVHRPGAYAKYFTFTLLSKQDVTIDLKSTKDTYLFLLNGSGQSGSKIAEDDDGGENSNSRIVRTLSAGTYTVEATTYELAITGDFVVSVKAVPSICTDCPFVINAGLNDAWFNTTTSGQGLTITVFPQIEEVFVAWFTFDTERPPEDVTAMLGEPGHRWLTAQGPYDGDTATLKIYVTKGGVFDSSQPAASTDPDGDGTLTLEFANCNEGLVTYEITSLGISGEIPIERIVTDNVPLCQTLANPQ